MALTAEQIKAAGDMASEKVDVPEWGGCVYVRPMDSLQADQFDAELTREGGADQIDVRGIRAKLVVLSTEDEAGNLLFTDADMDWLNHKSRRAVDRIIAVARRLSGLRNEDVEKLAKNFDAAPGGSSPSA